GVFFFGHRKASNRCIDSVGSGGHLFTLKDAKSYRSGCRRAAGRGGVMLARLRRAAARRVQMRFAAEIRARLANPLGKSDLFDDHALRVILCGTSSPLPDPPRAKSCVAVVAGGKAYIVDTGPESWKTLGLLNFPGGRIAAILLTHFHSDHIAALGEFRMQSWVGGRRRAFAVARPPGAGAGGGR